MKIDQPLHELLGHDKAVVLVVPFDQLPGLFSGRPEAAEDRFVPDLTIAQYKERYEPSRSESRIRELCAAGVFPDTEVDGEVIPGAYKDEAGEWRITLEGVIARQRRERRHGLDQRVPKGDHGKKELEEEPNTIGKEDAEPPTPRGEEPAKCSTTTRADTPVKRTPAARPRQGAWRKGLALPEAAP